MKEEALIRTCLAISCPLFNSLKNPVKEVALTPLYDEKFETLINSDLLMVTQLIRQTWASRNVNPVLLSPNRKLLHLPPPLKEEET